jgi:hypothetical protein
MSDEFRQPRSQELRRIIEENDRLLARLSRNRKRGMAILRGEGDATWRYQVADGRQQLIQSIEAFIELLDGHHAALDKMHEDGLISEDLLSQEHARLAAEVDQLAETVAILRRGQ